MFHLQNLPWQLILHGQHVGSHRAYRIEVSVVIRILFQGLTRSLVVVVDAEAAEGPAGMGDPARD